MPFSHQLSSKLSAKLPASLENNAQREKRALKILSMLILLAYISCVGLLPFIIAGNQLVFWIITGLISGGIAVSSFARRCSARPERVRPGSWALVTYLTLNICVAYYLVGASMPLIGDLCMVMLLSFFLLPWQGTMAIGLISVFSTAGIYLMEISGYSAPLQLEKPLSQYFAMIIGLQALLLCTLIGIFISVQFRRAIQLAFEQTERLDQAYKNIENKREFGEKLSQKINSVTTELSAAASQQVQGSQQQAQAIEEVIAFLRELAHMAEHIEDSTEQINESTGRVLNTTRRVKGTTEIAVKVGRLGREKVDETLQSSQEASERFQILVKTLNSLEQHSGKLGEVVNILRSISDETHLLALNATIEAAGAGEQGERFGVVAREIKALADRSMRSSREVTQILKDVESSVQQAVAEAESGQQAIGSTLATAQSSGQVIAQLVEAISESAEEMEQIEQLMTETSNLTYAITSSASQQSGASGQAVTSLQEVGTVAQQSATNSLQVTYTSRNLEELSHELYKALAA
jgi:methyl-accepting chemotaxis protein